MSEAWSQDLPAGWTTATIGELVDPDGEFTDGDWVESKDQDPAGDVRLIQLADVGDGSYLDKSFRFLTSQKAAELGCTFLRTGDILIARMPDPLGRACVFPGDPKPSVTVVDVCIVRPASTIDHRWLTSAINAPQFRGAVASLQSGSTRKRISRGNLSNLRLTIPPTPEQRRIADVIEQQLTRVDAAVADLARAKAQLARYRASVLKAACEGRLVPIEAELARAEGRRYEPSRELLDRILHTRLETPRKSETSKGLRQPVEPDDSTASEPPEGWCWASIDMVGDLLLGRQRAPQYLKGLHPRSYLRVANIKDDHIDFSDLEAMDFDKAHFERYKLRPGDILLSEGQSPELLGQSAIYRGEGGDLCFQKTLHRFRPIPEGPSPEYSQIVFRSHVKSGMFRRYGSITTNIAHLTLEKLRTVPFPLPPLAEQTRIVTEVDRLLSIADEIDTTLDTALARAERLRQSILKRAFEGKLVPQDPNDEPASVLLERIRKEREAEEEAKQRDPKPRRARGTRKPRAARS